MNGATDKTAEVVGTLSNRLLLDETVAALLAAGFERTDLSLLASHQSVEAMDEGGGNWKDAISALAGEYTVLGPLAVSGGIILAGGPAAAGVAAAVGAAVGGLALAESLRESLAESDASDVVRAAEAGSIIIWVRAEDAGKQDLALRILEENGAASVHVTE